MTALADVLSEQDGLELGIAWSSVRVPDVTRETSGRTTYYLLPRGSRRWAMSHTTGDLDHCRAAVEDFDPTLIHVHGSEDFYGLVGSATKRPMVLSIQGVVAAVRDAYFGQLRPHQIARMPELVLAYVRLQAAARREASIFRSTPAFLGRTDWDHAWQRSLNPSADYFDCPEMIRPEFHAARWSYDGSEPDTILHVTSCRPYKGTDVLLRALKRLIARRSGARLRIAGDISTTGFGGFLRREVLKLGLGDHVEFLGYLDAERLAPELERARVFALPSFIENSPNSLAEAMVVGVPCVATRVGGVPSMVRHGATGILAVAGDDRAMAEAIGEVLTDAALAVELSSAGRAAARARHDRTGVRDALLAAYAAVSVA